MNRIATYYCHAWQPPMVRFVVLFKSKSKSKHKHKHTRERYVFLWVDDDEDCRRQMLRTAGRWDIDNLAKPVIDALKAAGVYRDDSQAVRLVATRRGFEPPNGRLVVTITQSEMEYLP